MDKDTRKFFKGVMIATPISIVMWAGIFSIGGCVHKELSPPDYEICNTPNCGDNVEVKVEK